jgi:peptide chain release factor 1
MDLLERLPAIENRFAEVNQLLTDPGVLSDVQKLKNLSKEYKKLNKIIPIGQNYRLTLDNIANAKRILEEESDEEFRAMAKDDLAQLSDKAEKLAEELKSLLIPEDPEDSKNVVLEIRAGTGGDEAALFAGDLFEMYRRYAERKGFQFEVNDYHEGTVGGYKEISVSIRGEDCYGLLKFESGVHRVQRVPDTETQGRVHTSAATVAVMPEAEEFDIVLNENDIVKETFCSSGAGGQSVNTTYSAVRLTHVPTGIVVSMQNERSQIKNYELALKILKTRLYDMELEKRNAEQAALRKSLVSTGDRSAKVRTYNFPQSRVTDHRIGLTVYNLPAILSGDLDEFIDALRMAENLSKLENLQSV